MLKVNDKKILCLSPHPDDAEISIAGMTKKYNNSIFEIYVFSIGNENEGKMAGSFRLTEVENFWKIFDSTNTNVIPSGVNYVTSLNEGAWISKIEKTLDIKSYDIILVPTACDNHFEHRIVNNIGRSLSRSHPVSLIEYQTPSTRVEWQPNFYIENGREIFTLKSNALASAFRGQIENQRAYFRKDYMEIFSKCSNCTRKGMGYVEKFKILELYL
tara:strand:+ start:236 stop:880 length:645 start_codon:yes stop_codon:yes gene_type:complete